jgi:hypothetical protein
MACWVSVVADLLLVVAGCGSLWRGSHTILVGYLSACRASWGREGEGQHVLFVEKA